MHRLYPAALLIALTLVAGCACETAPKVIGTTDQDGFRQLAGAGAPVFLLPPLMTFADAATERPLPALPEYGSTHAEVAMAENVPQGLSEAGIRPITAGDLAPDDSQALAETIRRLTEESQVLLSTRKDKSALLPLLKQVAEVTGTSVSCVQTVRVKVGSGATYNPNTGGMTQGTSTTAVTVALVSLENGEVLWKNEAFVRYTPTSSKFRKAVEMLFAR